MIMIEPEDYRLPKKEPKKKKPKQNEDTVKWLEENMGFKPFTCEW